MSVPYELVVSDRYDACNWDRWAYRFTRRGQYLPIRAQRHGAQRRAVCGDNADVPGLQFHQLDLPGRPTGECDDLLSQAGQTHGIVCGFEGG